MDRPGPSYDVLFDLAWSVGYIYIIPNDDNRAADGLKLRERFERETSLTLPDLGRCRILEFLIALADRMNSTMYDYQDPDRVSYWFWILMDNLGLTEWDDSHASKNGASFINEVFSRLNLRLYNPDGTDGGLFPVRQANGDQRDVEIWYQMMTYLRENL